MNVLKLELYMMSQEELIEHIKVLCKNRSIAYNTDSYGNIWSIKYDNEPIFIAHADTVIGSDDNYKMPLLEKEGKLSRPGYVLGADCRAGVNLIVNHIENINWVITKDEEIGCVGASHLAKDEKFLSDLDIGSAFIELDRRGSNDIIGHKHGYCSKEFSDALIEVLIDYKESAGVFTDIDAFTHLRQGANISIGYYNAHSRNEYLNIDEFNYVNDKILELSEIGGNHRKVFTKQSVQRWKNYSVNENELECDWCGEKTSKLSRLDGYDICDTCASVIESNELICSNCQTPIELGELYVEIKDWNAVFCELCSKEKINR